MAGTTVLGGIAEQSRILQREISRAEGLQAMSNLYVVFQNLAIGQLVRLRDIIQEFAYKHGWRGLAVVANGLTDVADVQSLPRG